MQQRIADWVRSYRTELSKGMSQLLLLSLLARGPRYGYLLKHEVADSNRRLFLLQ